MTEHDWYQTQLAEYSAGLLEAHEADTIRAHLATCAACRDEVASMERALAYLPMAAPPVPPSPGFRDRTLRAALQDGGASTRRPPLWAWGLAASTIIAVGFAVQSRQSVARLSATLAVRESTVDSLTHALAMARDTLAVLGPRSTVRYAALTMPKATGGLMVFEDTVTHRWHLVAHGLPRLPEGQRYQLWYLCEGGMAAGTVLTMSPDGVARVTVGMPENPPGRVVGAAITVETIGAGTAAAGSGPKVAALML